MSDQNFALAPIANGARSTINGIAEALGLGPAALEPDELDHSSPSPMNRLRGLRYRVDGPRAGAQLHTLTTGAGSLARASSAALAPTTYAGHVDAIKAAPRRQAGRSGPLGYRVREWLGLGGAITTGNGPSPSRATAKPATLTELLRPCQNCGPGR